MPQLHWKTAFATVLCAAASVQSGMAQAPPAILYVEMQNVVDYQVDINDLAKFGTNPNITAGGVPTVACLGVPVIAVGDIVAVNGHPAKGTYVSRAMAVCLSTTNQPRFSIGDTTWNSIRNETYEILQMDGTPVGTIMTNGLNANGVTPPGPPVGAQNFAIVGGTGAFIGARGQKGNANNKLTNSVPSRTASIAEDPTNRRQNGGGHIMTVLYTIPMSHPEVVVTPNGPAITHSTDFSLVDASKPAAAGEVLSLIATGLGPTRVALVPGQPFPSSPLAQVNSPVDVTVNGKSADVLGAVGYPGAVDGYQINFRVPPDTAKGSAAIQVTAAWIAGAPVTIPIQ